PARERTLLGWDHHGIVLGRPTNLAWGGARRDVLHVANFGRTTIARVHLDGVRGQRLANQGGRCDAEQNRAERTPPLPPHHKIATVTGAADGAGKAIAELFAEEGAWVLVAGLDDAAGAAAAAAIRGRGGRAEFRHVDVSDEAQVAAAAREAAEAGGGRIDILC